MLDNSLDNHRIILRSRLLMAAKVMGFIGVIILAIPFVMSFNPSQAAIARTHLMIDLKTIPIDGYRLEHWTGLPMVIFRPGEMTIDKLRTLDSRTIGTAILDHESPMVFAYIAASTYRGCAVQEVKEEDEWLPVNWWVGGWVDPCHMGAWDYAGRTLRDFQVPKGVELPRLQTIPFEIINAGTDTYLYFRKQP